MRLSTKTRYGVRAMFDIAFHAGDQAVQAKEIAKREDIPLRYLEQIFQDLKRAQLVESKRGPRGGYFLKRPPADIRLADVVTALQGPIEDLFAGLEAEPEGPKCTLHLTSGLWRELTCHVAEWFRSITLAELVERAEKLGVRRATDSQPMYYI